MIDLYESISKQASRVVDMANLKAPPIVVRRELELLQDQIEKLPKPIRLPPRKKKEKWSKL